MPHPVAGAHADALVRPPAFVTGGTGYIGRALITGHIGRAHDPRTRAPPSGRMHDVKSPLAHVREICLALPNAQEKVSHGEPTFWVGQRMFATFASATNHHGAGRDAVWCKCSFVTQDHLLRTGPAIYFRPPYVGVRGWIGVYLDRDVDWTAVGDRVRYAYESAAETRKALTRKTSTGVTPRTRARRVLRKARRP